MAGGSGRENKKIKVTDQALEICEKLGVIGNRLLDDPDIPGEQKVVIIVPLLKGITDALKTTQKLEDSSGLPMLEDDEDNEDDLPSLDTEILEKIKKPKRKKKDKIEIEEEFEL